MEYAERGTLADQIGFAQVNKNPFKTDQILKWISQVILGVLITHSKGCLCRYLKSEHLFLSKDNVVKISNSYITELASTSDIHNGNSPSEIPYILAPEIINGEHYSDKSDVWTIGVILYELAMLKKPFEADSMIQIF